MPISKEAIVNQQNIEAQERAARLAMVVSGIDYDMRTIEGKMDRPVDAAKRLVGQGAINSAGMALLIEAGVITE